MNISNGTTKGFATGFGRRDSVGGGSGALGAQYGGGALPISMDRSNREKPRRESIASSVIGGMSFGGVSVGSWIRDE